MKMNVKKTNALRDSALKTAVIKKHKVLKSTEDSTVRKAVKNVKRILEEKHLKETKAKSKQKERKPQVPLKVTKSKISKRKSSLALRITNRKWRLIANRGIVYIGHIPHGFYEEQIKEYFSQFGKVTRVRLVKSRNTGRSRGYGYVEFLHSEVAKVAAETMHNYFMCGRLLKTTYIPPEKQHPGFFFGPKWTRQNYPKLLNRRKLTAIRNSKIDDKTHKQYVKKSLRKLSKLEKKLKERGLNLTFTSICTPTQTDKEA